MTGKQFYDANVESLSEFGSPGAAATVDVLDSDHPIVLPPREHDAQSSTDISAPSRRPRQRKAENDMSGDELEVLSDQELTIDVLLVRAALHDVLNRL